MKALECPNCHSEFIAEIFWGIPADMESIKEKLDKNEIVLGGSDASQVMDDHGCQPELQ